MLTQWCEDLGRLLLLRHQRMGNPTPIGSPDPMNAHMMTKSMSPAPNAVPNRLTPIHRR